MVSSRHGRGGNKCGVVMRDYYNQRTSVSRIVIHWFFDLLLLADVLENVTGLTLQQFAQLADDLNAHHRSGAESLDCTLPEQFIFPQLVSGIALIFQGCEDIDLKMYGQSSTSCIMVLVVVCFLSLLYYDTYTESSV